MGDNPDVYIGDPSESCILEVKGAMLQKSQFFPTRHTLRFPRVFKIRYDKDWFECMTKAELSIMIAQQAEK